MNWLWIIWKGTILNRLSWLIVLSLHWTLSRSCPFIILVDFIPIKVIILFQLHLFLFPLIPSFELLIDLLSITLISRMVRQRHRWFFWNTLSRHRWLVILGWWMFRSWFQSLNFTVCTFETCLLIRLLDLLHSYREDIVNLVISWNSFGSLWIWMSIWMIKSSLWLIIRISKVRLWLKKLINGLLSIISKVRR